MQTFRRSVGRLLPAVLICLCLCSLVSQAAETHRSYLAALESITTDDLRQHVEYLADDELEGREAGRRGGRTAGDYLGRQFGQCHLHGAGVDGGFFQPFEPNCRNVLGLLEGSDPVLKEQLIIVTAHYDHVGYGTKRNSRGPVGCIHNGADDNASGASALIELVEAFDLLPEPPKRSIMFASFDAEEKGMLGAKYWIAHPTVTLSRVSVVVNMDMIGRLRDDRLILFGTRSGYGLRRLISRQNEEVGLSLDFPWTLKANADHYVFFNQKIPVLMLHTGTHNDYHTPRDDAELINCPGMNRVVRLAFRMVYELADRPEVPCFRQAAGRETERTRRRLATQKVTVDDKPLRLGIAWRLDDSEPGTIVLTHVVSSSPAARAGLRIGDRIYQIAGRDFADEDQFSRLAKTLPDPLELLVERDGQLRTLVLYIEAQPAKQAAKRTGDELGCLRSFDFPFRWKTICWRSSTAIVLKDSLPPAARRSAS